MSDELLREINLLIEEGKLEPEHENRLMLAEITMLNRRILASEDQQTKILEKLDSVLENQRAKAVLSDRVTKLEAVADRVDVIENTQTFRVNELVAISQTVEQLAEIQERYPSLPWLAINRTKFFVFLMGLFIVAVLVIGTPWNVYDIRVVILDFIGIDPTLGLPP